VEIAGCTRQATRARARHIQARSLIEPEYHVLCIIMYGETTASDCTLVSAASTSLNFLSVLFNSILVKIEA
jgi:hypothetical protein